MKNIDNIDKVPSKSYTPEEWKAHQERRKEEDAAARRGANPETLAQNAAKVEEANRKKEIGERVEEARISRGLSREELAEKTGINYQIIGSIERGDQNITAEELITLAQTLVVSSDYLLTLTDVPTKDIKTRKVIEKYGLTEKSLQVLEIIRKNEKMFAPGPYDTQPLRVLNTILSSGANGARLLDTIHKILFFGEETVRLTSQRQIVTPNGLPTAISYTEGDIDAARMRKVELFTAGDILEDIRKRLQPQEKTDTKNRKPARPNSGAKDKLKSTKAKGAQNNGQR